MQARTYSLQALVLSLLLLLTVFISSSANAHEVRPAVVDLKLDAQGNYKLSIKLNLEAKISRIDNEHQDTDDADSTAIYDILREMPAQTLAEEFLLFEDYLLERIKLSFNGKRQSLEVKSIDIPPVGDLELSRDSVIYFEGKVPTGTKTLSWKWDKAFGNAVLRVGSPNNPELHSSYLL